VENEANHIQSATSSRYIDQAARFLSFYRGTRKLDTSTRPYFTKAEHSEAWDAYQKHFHGGQATDLPSDHWISSDDVYQPARKALLSVLFAFFCDSIEAPTIPDSQPTDSQPTDSQPTEGEPTKGKPKPEGPQEHHPVASFTIIASTNPREVLAKPRDTTRLIAALQWLTRYTVWGHIQLKRAALKDPPPMQVQVEEYTNLWLRESKQTVFSWMRYIMRLGTSFVMNDEAIGRFTYVGKDAFILDGQKITVSSWRNMVKKLLQELQERFSALCEFVGMEEDELELPERPYDHNTCELKDYWLGTEKSNELYGPIQLFVKKALCSGSLFAIVRYC